MDCIEQIRDIVVSEINPDQIVLFGSRARGDYCEDSDYDILILKSLFKNRRKTLKDLRVSLYKKGVCVAMDILLLDTAKYVQLSDVNGLVYRDIKQEGKVIYGRL
jgi:DNA polymerase sigma